MSVAYDHTGPWTVDDVLALDEDRRYRYELLDGTLMMSPAPGVRHQRASYKLRDLLHQAAAAAGAPVEVLEGINVRLPGGLFVPDIAVVESAAADENPVAVDADALWLVVEIVSPGNGRMDRKVKPGLYAEAGIPHFWRLELEPAPSLVVMRLDGGRYVERTTALPGTVTTLATPFLLDVDPGRLTLR